MENKRIDAVAPTFKKHRKGISRADRVLIRAFRHRPETFQAREEVLIAIF